MTCKNNTKNAKIAIFASLIAIMVIPFSVLHVANAEQDQLERDYERIDELGEQGYNLHLRIDETVNAKARTQLEYQFDNVLRQLEHYGVTTIEKAESDPYWAVRSSQHQNGELDPPAPIAGFLLPYAYAVDQPDFQLGYEHEFWTYFSWHQWTGDWITIAEDDNDDDSITLQDDYDWINAKWQVRGTNIFVEHTYYYKLKNGSTIMDSDLNYANNPSSTIHNGYDRVRIIDVDRYDDSPQEGWKITADWTVQNINDWP